MKQLAIQNKNEIAQMHQVSTQTLETVLIRGDLKQLTSDECIVYYNKVCEVIGLNPLTRPFEYLEFQGKKILYARKECAEQLRMIYGVSIFKLDGVTENAVYKVTAYARFVGNGKEDISTGVVDVKGLSGAALANAMMKAETKAKRRVTLSICGLSLLDESEIEDMKAVDNKPQFSSKSEALVSILSPKNDSEIVESEIIEVKPEQYPNTPPGELQYLIDKLSYPKEKVDEWLKKANVNSIDDLSEMHMFACIDMLANMLTEKMKIV